MNFCLVFYELPVENIFWCIEFNLVIHENIGIQLINIISCSIVMEYCPFITQWLNEMHICRRVLKASLFIQALLSFSYAS